eukprot:2564514-Pyramimonas_sp.AAC.1
MIPLRVRFREARLTFAEHYGGLSSKEAKTMYQALSYDQLPRSDVPHLWELSEEYRDAAQRL